jgi:hypothetical protein
MLDVRLEGLPVDGDWTELPLTTNRIGICENVACCERRRKGLRRPN